MKTVTAILVIFCAYSYAATKEIDVTSINILKNVSNIRKVVSNTTVISNYMFNNHRLLRRSLTSEESISMLLYTRDIPYGKIVGVDVHCNVLDHLIVVLVHGFASKANHSINYRLTKELIKKGFTVFSLDWSEVINTTSYLPLNVRWEINENMVQNTRKVGQFMAKYVISLIDKCGALLNNIIFVGHSLGAHVCGFASKEIKKSHYGVVPLIFSCDPAGPQFEHNKCEDRLCATDAITIIVLHTSSKYGIKKSIGHIDLYFDSGFRQPGCSESLDITCDHFMAMLYLAFAVDNTCKFSGVVEPYQETIFSKLPSYPQNNIIDSFIMDSTIFDYNKGFNKFKRKSYYMYVNSFCTLAIKARESSSNNE